MAFGNVKGFFGFGNGDKETKDIENLEDTHSDDFYNNVESETGKLGSNKMILFEPRAYSESSQITDYLKKRNTVVVNLKRVTPDVAKRIVDFLQGSLYAMNGSLQKLGGGIFLCTPNNVNIEGKITDEGAKTKGTKKEEKEEEEEFSW